ncbi:hypothetical protein QBC42DRAFT_272843 [Cladorrhinum samala]|uniref:Uncharacterized protein n=1 Tax=Cladorrhinum samala TaxID=585594 RepID=A0AAV9HI23_9PEZI|nr:hypothetical protein QBC42DRAFT_272843 [Cladorrhinum samala]
MSVPGDPDAWNQPSSSSAFSLDPWSATYLVCQSLILSSGKPTARVINTVAALTGNYHMSSAAPMQPPYSIPDVDGASVGSCGTPSPGGGSFAIRYPGRPFRNSEATPTDRVRNGLPQPATVGQLPIPGKDRRGNASSATWTSSSGDLAGLSDTDDIQERDQFVQEYNRLARKVRVCLHHYPRRRKLWLMMGNPAWHTLACARWLHGIVGQSPATCW